MKGYFLVFRLWFGVISFLLVLRYWYWDTIFHWYVLPQSLTEPAPFIAKFKIVLLLIAWVSLTGALLGSLITKYSSKSLIVVATTLSLIVGLDPLAYSDQLGVMTLLAWALVLTFYDHSFRITHFIIRTIYVIPMVSLGINKLYSPNWMNGAIWDQVMLVMNSQSLLGKFLIIPALKWDMLILIPLLEVSACFLLRKHRYFYYQVSILFGYHLIHWIWLLIRNPHDITNGLPLLQGICLMMMLPKADIELGIQKLRNLFIRSQVEECRDATPFKKTYPKLVISFVILYGILQVIVPMRPYFFSEDINWTCRGSLCAWRMMLNSRQRYVVIKVIDQDGEEKTYRLEDFFGATKNSLISDPYALWRLAQQIYQKQKLLGKETGVYILAYQSLNRSKFSLLIDPHVDLCKVSFNHFGPNSWIFPADSQILDQEIVYQEFHHV